MGAVEFIPGPVTATIRSLREIRSHKRAHRTRTSCFLIAAMALAAAAEQERAPTPPRTSCVSRRASSDACQTAPAVRYVSRGPGYTLFLTRLRGRPRAPGGREAMGGTEGSCRPDAIIRPRVVPGAYRHHQP